MIEIEVIVRKWGNSLGFIFPRAIVRKIKIKPGKKIRALLEVKE